MGLKIGFTGTQRGLTPIQTNVLRELLTLNAGLGNEFHHGDCIGADCTAQHIAQGLSYRLVIHPPYSKDKRAWCRGDEVLVPKSYLDRNHDIVEGTEVLIATPGERSEQLRSGTWATVRYARKRGREIYLLYPDGTSEIERGTR